MAKPVFHFMADVVQWVISIVAIGALHGAGVIENPAIALAAVALWLAIRARRKADVNTVSKISEEV
jgi:hypothetical protein